MESDEEGGGGGLGVNKFQKFCRREGLWRIHLGMGLMIKGDQFLLGFRLFTDSNSKFYILLLYNFTVYVKTERCCIMFLAYFVLLKVF